jgi:recombination DNA repair RAD52 pathway protein
MRGAFPLEKDKKMTSPFTQEQLTELDKELNPLLISTRKGGSGSTLKYIEGHDAIDQGNRVFGYGQWAPRVLDCKAVVIMDPVTGEACGVTYEATVEVQVAGCLPIVEVGQQAVSVWNVQDVVMSRRKEDSDMPITAQERINAQRAIVDAHEVARKGAVTDGEKRCLRILGNQFGNGLYGDGRVILIDGNTLDEQELKTTFAKVYKVKEAELDKRWSGFIVYALGKPVKDLSPENKVQIHATIQQQLRKAS